MKLHKTLKLLHLIVLGLMLSLSSVYELSYIIWKHITDDTTTQSTGTLLFLAIIELLCNMCNVYAVILLGYMMDKITDKFEEDFLEPILHLEVPFFVRLASVKLMNKHL